MILICSQDLEPLAGLGKFLNFNIQKNPPGKSGKNIDSLQNGPSPEILEQKFWDRIIISPKE